MITSFSAGDNGPLRLFTLVINVKNDCQLTKFTSFKKKTNEKFYPEDGRSPEAPMYHTDETFQTYWPANNIFHKINTS